MTQLDTRRQSLEQRLQELLDKEDIRQAIYAYARGVDRCNPELIGDSYHVDAWDDHGNFRGGRDDVVGSIMSRQAAATNSMHHVGNILIELHDDTANVETYFMACQTLELDGKQYTRMRSGRYLDQFERRDGRWRILRRTVVDDWSRLDEIVALAPTINAECKIGTRDRLDPSYELSDFTQVFHESDGA